MNDTLPPHVGVFDSGIGGLTVLRALRERVPGVPLSYVADSAYAPYGERAVHHIVERSTRIAEHLVDRGARCIVVACNTATAAAIDALRERWPAIAFVGVEPGIKPAVARSAAGRIAVMATPATIASGRLQRLIERHAGGAHVHLQACPGLADAIERGDWSDAALDPIVRPLCERIRAAQVDTVVLGCTHYPFIAERIARWLGDGIAIVDTATAVATHAASLCGAFASDGSAEPVLATTGEGHALEAVARHWLGHAGAVQRLSI